MVALTAEASAMEVGERADRWRAWMAQQLTR
jgi:hypothetical protein